MRPGPSQRGGRAAKRRVMELRAREPAAAGRADERARGRARRAASRGCGFSRDRELLNLREVINKKEKEILDLKDDLDSKERQILDHKDKVRELERKVRDMDEKLLGIEREIVSANGSARRRCSRTRTRSSSARRA